MKKIISVLLLVMGCIFLVACGNEKESPNDKTAKNTVQKEENSKTETQAAEEDHQNDESATATEMPSKSKKKSSTLVVYFSATGNTKGIAESIANGLQADLYEIIPEKPYTDEDLNYNDDNSRSTLEMKDSSARPAISGKIENFDEYDTVFLGYPIWWGEAPRILDTFVESYDFSGKKVILFCTSASSGIGSSADTLEKLAGNGKWMDGQRFNQNESADKVVEWASQFE